MNPSYWTKVVNKPNLPSPFSSHTDSMAQTSVNSSTSDSDYFWAECLIYDDGPSAGFILLMTTDCFEFLVGVPLNVWLIWHICSKRSGGSGVLPADFYPLHMALTQIGFYMSMPLVFANNFIWQSSSVMVLTTLLTAMVMAMKPLLLCLVCVERYMAVVRPLDYLRFKSHQYRWGLLGASWCLYVIVAVVVVFRRSSVSACVVFLPALAIDTFCSLSVLKALQKSPPGDREMKEDRRKNNKQKVKTRQNMSAQVCMEGNDEENVKKSGSSEPKVKGEMNAMKRKAFNTTVIIQAVVSLNYLPFFITLLIEGRFPAQEHKCQYMALAVAAATSCGYLQPLLYLHRLGRLPCVRSCST